MGMEIVHQVRAECDDCGKEYGWSLFNSVRECVEQIVSEGWYVKSMGRNGVWCPHCKAKPDKSWND